MTKQKFAKELKAIGTDEIIDFGYAAPIEELSQEVQIYYEALILLISQADEDGILVDAEDLVKQCYNDASIQIDIIDSNDSILNIKAKISPKTQTNLLRPSALGLIKSEGISEANFAKVPKIFIELLNRLLTAGLYHVLNEDYNLFNFEREDEPQYKFVQDNSKSALYNTPDCKIEVWF